MHYSDAIAEQICDRLIEGESMRQICATDGFPSRSSLLRWMADDESFEAKCARARTMQADLMDDKILETAESCTEANCQSSKVKISAYQWRASKLAPKKYGDKVSAELTGPDGGPIQAAILVEFVNSHGRDGITS